MCFFGGFRAHKVWDAGGFRVFGFWVWAVVFRVLGFRVGGFWGLRLEVLLVIQGVLGNFGFVLKGSGQA